jgi:D-inositol-3-phosphate glycosyltransferase
MRENLRIVLYEPSGRGGICHYTYQLAESLAGEGAQITVFTSENYELRHVQRKFRVYFHARSSRLKKVFEKARRFLRRKKAAAPDCVVPPHSHPARPVRQGSRSGEVLAQLRRWYTRLVAVVAFLRHRPALIHFQWVTRPAEDYYFIKLLRLFGFPIVYTVHNVLPHNNKSTDMHTVFQKIYHAADHLIVHAERNKQDLINDFSLRAEKISVIPHGSYDFFARQNALSQNDARAALQISQAKKVILFFGAIRRNKGLEYLLDAFQHVKANVTEVLLLVAGKGGGKNGERSVYYTDLVERLTHCDGVKFVEQYIPVEQVNCYVAAADVVVLPYVTVSQSGVLLLAYAAGKPVVVTDVGGLGEVVEHGSSGFIVPPTDVHALAQAITTILCDGTLRKAMGQRAQALAATVYSWKQVASRTCALYRSVIAQRKGPDTARHRMQDNAISKPSS